ncbi:MAG: hypothetical protein PHW87_01920 [Methanothrix sp.]|nr:hypothetical protein [Methanothrix sp.]
MAIYFRQILKLFLSGHHHKIQKNRQNDHGTEQVFSKLQLGAGSGVMKKRDLLMASLLFLAVPAMVASACEFKVSNWNINIGSETCLGGPSFTWGPMYWTHIGSDAIYSSTVFLDNVNVYLYETEGSVFSNPLSQTGPALAKMTISIQDSNIVTQGGKEYYIAKGETSASAGLGGSADYLVITQLDDQTMIVIESVDIDAASNAATSLEAWREQLSLS